jgi:hypothetical protein
MLVLVLVAGYFGFVPGVSSLFGSDKPADLGITYTRADYQAARTGGLLQQVAGLPAVPMQQSLVPPGAQAAELNLTDEQVTALIDEDGGALSPLKDCQLKFNADGSAEFSGILMLDKLSEYARAKGITDSGFKSILAKLETFGYITKELPFYIKGTGSVVDGYISFNVTQFKLGRLSIPVGMVNGRKNEMMRAFQADLLATPGFDMYNFGISAGLMHFDGTLPAEGVQVPGT